MKIVNAARSFTEPLFTEAFVERFDAKRQRAGPNDCWPWQASVGGSGYGHMWAVIEGKRTCRDAHQIAWMIEHRREPVGLVMHECDNKLCTNPAHLHEGTHKQNIQDAMRSGLIVRKLDAARASSIVVERNAGSLVIELAGRYGVRVGQIKSILRGKAWAPVTGIHMLPAVSQIDSSQLAFAI